MTSRLSRHQLRGWTLFLGPIASDRGGGCLLAVGLAALAAVSSVIAVPLAVARRGWAG